MIATIDTAEIFKFRLLNFYHRFNDWKWQFSLVRFLSNSNLKPKNVRNPSFQVGHGNIISIDSSCEIKNLKHDAHIMFTSRDECPCSASTFLLRSSFLFQILNKKVRLSTFDRSSLTQMDVKLCTSEQVCPPPVNLVATMLNSADSPLVRCISHRGVHFLTKRIKFWAIFLSSPFHLKIFMILSPKNWIGILFHQKLLTFHYKNDSVSVSF